MNARDSLLPSLDRDVSRVKIEQLLEVLRDRTERGLLEWESTGEQFSWNSPRGVVAVAPGEISIYDDNGVRLRQFRPAREWLYEAVVAHYRKRAERVITAIMVDLEEAS